MSDKQKPMLGKNGFKYKPQYGVIIICEDERHQQKIYQVLKAQGHTLKVVTV